MRYREGKLVLILAEISRCKVRFIPGKGALIPLCSDRVWNQLVYILSR